MALRLKFINKYTNSDHAFLDENLR